MTVAALAQDVVALLVERGLRIAIAESLTGGGVMAAVTTVPGSSAVLLGGVVAYHSGVKRDLLGVDAALLDRVGAVDGVVAAQMAQGVRDACAVGTLRADIGVATTGVAGPTAHDGSPVGTVYIAVAGDADVVVREYAFTGGRAVIRRQAVACALGMVREYGSRVAR